MSRIASAFNQMCIRAYIEYENTAIEAAEAVDSMRKNLKEKIAELRVSRRLF